MAFRANSNQARAERDRRAHTKKAEKQKPRGEKSSPRKAAQKTRADTAAPFSVGDLVVYPSHGVGKVTKIETQVIGGNKIKLFVISFDRDRMTLRVPLLKATTSGLRKLSTRPFMKTALTALTGRAKINRGIWNRRALEYVAKINSGNPLSIAEVVRDLHQRTSQNERSYSERLLYEQALERLTREVAAVEKIEPDAATTKLVLLLNAT